MRRTSKRIQVLALIVLFAGVPVGCGDTANDETASADTAGSASRSDAERSRIAVIPKGTTHVFWRSVERGGEEAGEELGVEILWKGPLKENDRAQQIQVVQQFLSQQVDGIVLAPLDFKALVPPVREARKRGVPVVIFDSRLEGTPGEDFVSFVATDNHAAGAIAGRHALELLGGGGKVVVLRYQVGSASTMNREEGFLEVVGEADGIEVVSENRYAGATAGEAKTAALNMIEWVRKADLVFCPNESSTYGMLLALRQEGLADKVKLIGFDSSPPLVKALTAGEIAALVVQDPRGMGYKAVQAVVKKIRGETPEPHVDTGAVLVTRENRDEPHVKSLID